MSTTISTTSSEGGECNPRDTAKCGCRLGLCKNDNGWETSATPGQGATPAQQPKFTAYSANGYRIATFVGDAAQSKAEAFATALATISGACTHVASGCERDAAAEIIVLRALVADAEHARAVAVATLSEQLDAANRTWAVRVSVPDAVDHHRLIGTTLVDIGHSDRVYIVESDEISRAFAERDAANVRVATLEAECVAVRLAQQAWDVLCSDRCPEDQDDLQAECKRLDDAADAARAATGPIGGVH